ncbi:hypothetical protein CPC08DRAFT_706726 [Agrocybe pediades]|nr:hypothetical protein CPC08DRAFT_706726 [Agrocybe pediades]
MSSLDDSDIPSVSFQKAELDGFVESNMLTVFLTGIYTMIYCWTFYIYLHRKAAHHISILGVITVIYVLSFVPSAIIWYQTKLTFIDNGDNMLDAFNFMYNSLSISFLDTITDTCQNLVIILADGLLMWRCYLVWTGSRQIAYIPCALWLIEGILVITVTAADIVGINDFSDAHGNLMNGLSSAFFFTSALTSLIATYLIAYRIYVTSQFTGTSKRRFKNVIDIVVQSSAVYTLSILAMAIYDVIPFSNSDSGTIALDLAVDYAGSLSNLLIGMMPTLMVARVAMSSENDDTTVVMAPGKPSAIHFQSRGADFRESWESVESGKRLDLGVEKWTKDLLQLDRV